MASLALAAAVAPGCGGGDESAETGGAETAETGVGGPAETPGGEAADTAGGEAAEAAGPRSVDTSALANSLERFFLKLEPREPWKVKCPKTVRPAKGGRFKCTVRGERVVWNFAVVQRNDQGKVSYVGKPQYLREFPGLDPKIKIKRTATFDIVP
jgi:hypothetical protein